jgi:anaerobic magnesium-protoporphyrin IX monomethyl ester cyclase
MEEKIKIALINPRIESYSSTLPPLGLLYIASLLEKNNYNVKIFDVYPYDDRDIINIVRYKPEIIGMTVLTDYWSRAKYVAEKITAELRASVYIIGGIHVTALPEKSFTELGADIGVVGEGEYTMLELCKKIADNLSWKDVAGIIYKDENGNFVSTPARPLIENLDILPFPARHLLEFENYLVPPGIIRGHWTERSTTVMTSRGCAFSCIWCGSQNIFGRKVRYRSVDNVLDELQLLSEKYHIDTVWFVDDTFTLKKSRVLEFCQKVESRKIKLTFGCQAHVKTADEEMFMAMKKAGFVQLDFGVESGSDKVLENLKKNSDATSIKKAFQLAKKTGLRTAATFMFGLPSETEEDVQKTFSLAKEINPNFTSSFFLTPYPGTELMDMVEKNKWEIPYDRSKFGLKKRPSLLINFSEKRMFEIRKQFQKMFAFRNFFSLFKSPDYFFKAIWLILSYPLGLFKGLKAYFKTFVFDDFIFAFLIYYTKQKIKNKDAIK